MQRASRLLPLLLLAAVPLALAQEPFLHKPYSVPDTKALFDTKQEARQAAEVGDWARMAFKLQSILDYFRTDVVLEGPVRDEFFVGAREWTHGFLDTLPEEGVRAYRTLAGPIARDLIGRATRERDAALLEDVVRRLYRSGEGPAARRALATLHLTSGDFAEAAHHLGALAADFPAEAGTGDRALLLFALANAGDLEGYERALAASPGLATGAEPIVVGGREVPVREFVAPLAERARASAGTRPRPRNSWPVLGGSAARDVPAPPITEIGRDGWAVRTRFRYKREDTARDFEVYRRHPRWEPLGPHYPIHPVVDGGVLYFMNGYEVFAVNLYTEKLLWSFTGPLRFSEGNTNVGTTLSPALADGVVYANLEVPVPMPDPDSRAFNGRTVIFYIPQRRLFALQAATGKVLWSHEDEEVRGTPDEAVLRDVNVNSPPLVVGDTIYVTASRQELRFFCYLLAVDAKTGRVKWRTRLCAGQQELNLFGRPMKELAPSAVSERDGVLYCSTNLGVVAAVDRRSGEILWLKGYRQVPVPFAMYWHTTRERMPNWANNPPVVTEDLVVFTPTDSRTLLALDRITGKVRFAFDGGDPAQARPVHRYLLGVGPERLYVAGPQVLALDLRTGKVVWNERQGAFPGRAADGEEEEARGRGLVTDDAVYTMTQRSLHAFDLETGDLLRSVELIDPEEDLPDLGGNLVFAGQVLLVARRERIAAFYLWEEVYRGLGEQARLHPDNGQLALELGEVCARRGLFEEAVRSYRRALALAERQGGEKGDDLSVAAKRGLYDIHMRQGRAAWEEDRRKTALAQYRLALKAAVSPADRIRALLAVADYHRVAGETAEIGKVYRELADDLGSEPYEFPSLGRVPAGLFALAGLTDLALDGGRPEEAIGHLGRILAEFPRLEFLGIADSGAWARERIDAIIAEHGREVYARFEMRAETLLLGAEKAGSVEGLEAVPRLFPNSRAAGRAAAALGRLLVRRGDHRAASTTLRRLLSEFPDADEAPEMLYFLAVSLEKRGYLLSTKSILSRLTEQHPDEAIVTDEGRVVLGEWARGRLAEEQFVALANREVRLDLPLGRLWLADEGETAFVRLLDAVGTAPAAEGQLLVGTNGVLRAVDGRSGRVNWQREMNGIVTHPVYAENVLALVNNTSVTGVDPKSGETLWQMPSESSLKAVEANPAAIFVLSAEFRDPTALTLRAFAPRSGTVLWERELPDHQSYELLLVTEEVVGVASRDPAGVEVFDAATGRLRYRVEMAPRSLYREPFLVDGDKLFVVHGNQRLELNDASSGRRLWSTRLPDERYFRSAIPVPGGIFFTDTRDHLLFIDAADGSIRWTAPPVAGSPLQFQGEAGDAQRVYVVRQREKDGVYEVEARDLRDGRVDWRADLLAAKSATPAPLLTELYVVYHVNAYDFGQGAWTSETVFLDKAAGRVVQRIAPEELSGVFTYAHIVDGLFALDARSRVAVYGPK